MRKMILAAILFTGSLSLLADEYQYLTVAHAGVEQSLELAAIHKISFDVQAGNVLITTTQGVATFPLSEMEKMYFSATATAIEAMPLQSDKLLVEGNRLTVGGTGVVRIYGSNGALQRMARVQGGTVVSLENLPKGLYVVTMGDQTIKVIR